MTSNTASILALDIGEKRIGVAITSRQARLPHALTTLSVHEGVTDDIVTLAHDQNADVIVVGLPRNLDGDETAQTASVRAFVGRLEQAYEGTVYFTDEAGTSVQAESELRERGKPYTKADIDSLAAVYILQDFLTTESEQHA